MIKAQRCLTPLLAFVSVLVLTAAGSAVAAVPPPSVDLAISYDVVALAPGATGTQRLWISNHGSEDTAGATNLTYVIPFYVNVDHDPARPLPAGCGLALADQDPTVPEMVSCNLDAVIKAGDRVSVDIPIKVTTRARFAGANSGMAIAAPGPKSVQPDANIGDNWVLVDTRMTGPGAELPAGNRMDLWLTHDVPPIEVGGDAEVTLLLGNRGPEPMVDKVRLTIVSPFYVDVQPTFAQGCRYRLQDPSPLVPEVVLCDLAPHSKGQRTIIKFLMKLVAGAPQGHLSGIDLAAPIATNDVDVSQINNLDALGVDNIG